MSKFTSALMVEGNDWHVTLCFCDAVKGGKFKTSAGRGRGTIVGVEYWQKPDVTVLIIDSEYIEDRHKYYKSLGYSYDHEFIPHATISKGDTVNEHSHFKGEFIIIGDEYARIY